MSTALLAVIAVILCVLFRILNVNSQPSKPSVYCKDLNFLDTILKIAPVLQEPYIPTRLWGFSGHVQTIVHSIVGRVKCPWPLGERVYLTLKDGATLTYDLYQPLDTSMSRDAEDDFTLAICPGIGNTSESVYIRTFVHYAQCHGYRCAVLNHVGALSSVRVTSPRIFTYGGQDDNFASWKKPAEPAAPVAPLVLTGHTGDYMEMVTNIVERHPSTKIVSIGFSLGGNLVTKYMGETKVRKPSNIIAGISVCQGYSATEGTRYLLNWQNFRRVYLYAMTENVKSIILRHRHILLSEEIKQRFGLMETDIVAAATLPELDEAYTRKVHSFGSLLDMYTWSSSVNYLSGITIPMVFINAKDDPIVPDPLLDPIRMYSSSNDKSLYLELSHGGHLGFYEGGLMYPNPVTWLDRSLVALVGGLAYVHANTSKRAPTPPVPSTAFVKSTTSFTNEKLVGQHSRTLITQM